MDLAKKVRQIALMIAMLAPAGIGPALAQTSQYVAPKGASGSCTGTRGAETCPWVSVSSALLSGTIKGGDTLLLMDGQHDRIDIEGRSYSPSLTIQSLNPRKAIVDTVFLRTASGVTFRELTIQSSLTTSYHLFLSEGDTSMISLENSDVKSVGEVSNVLSWSAAEWLTRRRHGVWMNGTKSRVTNCTVNVVQSGIWTSGTGNIISGNTITNVSGDALRAGTETFVLNNYVANFFRVDEDHIDGFQSIGSITNPIKGLRLRRNTILEWTYPSDHPLHAGAQGIGMFDGYYDDFSIKNNVVSVSSHHGIAIYGGRNGVIANNTVVQPSDAVTTAPWIAVFDHKNGSPSVNVIIANNLAMSFSGPSAANNVVLIDNRVITKPSSVFENAAAFDFRPKLSSGYVDTGNVLYASKADIDGVPRPQGNGPDRGAYEYVAGAKSVSRKQATGSTQKTQSLASLTAEDDAMPQFSAAEIDESSEETNDVVAGEKIYDNKKPIRLRRFWTDGAVPLTK